MGGGQFSGYAIGWTEIGTAFGASGKRAKVWRRSGAPILLLGDKPVTRIDDLWYWLIEHKDEAGDAPDLDGLSAAAAKKILPESGEQALMVAMVGRVEE